MATHAMHPLTLRFPDDDLERAFVREYGQAARRTVRATLLLVAGLFVVFALLDRALFADIFGTLLLVRGAIIAILLGAVALSWHPVYPRVRSWVLGLAGLAVVVALLGMMTLTPVTHRGLYYPAVGLAVLGTFTLFHLRIPVAAAWSVVYVVAYEAYAPMVDVPTENLVMAHFFLVSALLIGALAGWAIERYARHAFLHERDLEGERERSERLLRNVLPDPIAERLKESPGPIADRFAEATVMFADIVDFSGMSARLGPEELVGELNAVFTAFDRIAADRGIEKIKTIGDAYMAVAGIPTPVEDHLERVLDAARAMMDEIARHGDVGGTELRIRIGISTGPVVAGVIGESKFIYDLWGEPVTLASRMETHGVPGRIQVTKAVVERVDGRFAFEPRGEIDIKGHGRMEVWLVADGEADRGGDDGGDGGDGGPTDGGPTDGPDPD